MFGRLSSIPRTFVGAMVLGLGATYFLGYAPTRFDWVSNVRGALPLIVLFVVLLLIPQDRLRGISQIRSRERPRVASVRQAAGWAVGFVGIVFLLSRVADPVMMGPWVNALAFSIVALSLVPLTGYAGEINLVPLSFGAIGIVVAYHTGIEGIGVESRMTWVGIVAGVAATAVVGGLVALPALRLRGLYLALATLAFGGIMSTLVLREINVRHWFGLDIALFPNARLIVPRPKIGPLDLDENTTFLMALAVVFAVLGVVVVAVRNSGYGRRLVAMRDSPAATAMLGQSLIRLKLGVFMLSAGIAGLGGVLLASAQGSVSGDDFLVTGQPRAGDADRRGRRQLRERCALRRHRRRGRPVGAQRDLGRAGPADARPRAHLRGPGAPGSVRHRPHRHRGQPQPQRHRARHLLGVPAAAGRPAGPRRWRGGRGPAGRAQPGRACWATGASPCSPWSWSWRCRASGPG